MLGKILKQILGLRAMAILTTFQKNSNAPGYSTYSSSFRPLDLFITQGTIIGEMCRGIWQTQDRRHLVRIHSCHLRLDVFGGVGQSISATFPYDDCSGEEEREEATEYEGFGSASASATN